MVYLAELLVVMTDRLKIVRIRARNVHRGTRTQALIYLLLRRRRVSVSLQESDSVVFSTTCACLAVASKQESCHDSMPSSL